MFDITSDKLISYNAFNCPESISDWSNSSNRSCFFNKVFIWSSSKIIHITWLLLEAELLNKLKRVFSAIQMHIIVLTKEFKYTFYSALYLDCFVYSVACVVWHANTLKIFGIIVCNASRLAWASAASELAYLSYNNKCPDVRTTRNLALPLLFCSYQGVDDEE